MSAGLETVGLFGLAVISFDWEKAGPESQHATIQSDKIMKARSTPVRMAIYYTRSVSPLIALLKKPPEHH